MPVDDANLDVIRLDLVSKLDDLNTQKKIIQKILKNINNITMIDDDVNPGQKKMPDDPGLGVQYNPSRRDAVYDNIVVDAAAL